MAAGCVAGVVGLAASTSAVAHASVPEPDLDVVRQELEAIVEDGYGPLLVRSACGT